jgi:predicted nucleic acid-binding protein
MTSSQPGWRRSRSRQGRRATRSSDRRSRAGSAALARLGRPRSSNGRATPRSPLSRVHAVSSPNRRTIRWTRRRHAQSIAHDRERRPRARGARDVRYLLDTNVLSDFVRGDADVARRFKTTRPEDIAVSTITLMEIDYGIALQPARGRKLGPLLDAIRGRSPSGASEARAPDRSVRRLARGERSRPGAHVRDGESRRVSARGRIVGGELAARVTRGRLVVRSRNGCCGRACDHCRLTSTCSRLCLPHSASRS